MYLLTVVEKVMSILDSEYLSSLYFSFMYTVFTLVLVHGIKQSERVIRIDAIYLSIVKQCCNKALKIFFFRK